MCCVLSDFSESEVALTLQNNRSRQRTTSNSCVLQSKITVFSLKIEVESMIYVTALLSGRKGTSAGLNVETLLTNQALKLIWIYF